MQLNSTIDDTHKELKKTLLISSHCQIFHLFLNGINLIFSFYSCKYHIINFNAHRELKRTKEKENQELHKNEPMEFMDKNFDK